MKLDYIRKDMENKIRKLGCLGSPLRRARRDPAMPKITLMITFYMIRGHHLVRRRQRL